MPPQFGQEKVAPSSAEQEDAALTMGDAIARRQSDSAAIVAVD